MTKAKKRSYKKRRATRTSRRRRDPNLQNISNLGAQAASGLIVTGVGSQLAALI